MKLINKKIFQIILALMLFISPAIKTSAATGSQFNKDIKQYNISQSSLSYSQNSLFTNREDLLILDKTTETIQDGDYTIEVTNTTYASVNNDATFAANAYNDEFKTQEFNISRGDTKLFWVILDASFKYNNKYAYVSEKMKDYRCYNGATFSNASTIYTKKTDNAKVAKFSLQGNLKSTVNGIKKNDKFYFEVSCTNKGVVSANAKQL